MQAVIVSTNVYVFDGQREYLVEVLNSDLPTKYKSCQVKRTITSTQYVPVADNQTIQDIAIQAVEMHRKEYTND